MLKNAYHYGIFCPHSLRSQKATTIISIYAKNSGWRDLFPVSDTAIHFEQMSGAFIHYIHC